MWRMTIIYKARSREKETYQHKSFNWLITKMQMIKRNETEIDRIELSSREPISILEQKINV